MTSCKSRLGKSEMSTATQAEVPSDFYFSLRKTVCFGQCPAYEFQVQAQGELLWEGHYFVSKIGRYRRILSPSELSSLYNRLESAKLERYKPIYDEESISDLPKATLKYRAKGVSREITCRYRCPSELLELIGELEQRADTAALHPAKP
jgi:hypothetical protein